MTANRRACFRSWANRVRDVRPLDIAQLTVGVADLRLRQTTSYRGHNESRTALRRTSTIG